VSPITHGLSVLAEVLVARCAAAFVNPVARVVSYQAVEYSLLPMRTCVVADGQQALAGPCSLPVRFQMVQVVSRS
jgi:hypothetical protein